MLLLSPIECSTADACQALADHSSLWVTRSTIAVAAGVALEGIEIVHDTVAWIKRLRREKKETDDLKQLSTIFPAGKVTRESMHSDHPGWIKRCGRIGLVLVVIGVVGEWRYGARLEDAHNAIHKLDLALLADAATSAKIAHDEADAVKTEYDALKTGLDAASAELSDVEYRALLQEDRKELLVGERRKKLIKALKPFRGQNIDVQCPVRLGSINGLPTGTEPSFDEMTELATSLIGVFNDAHWNAPKSLSGARSSLRGKGVSVNISPDASPDTRKAARALVEALGDIPLVTAGPIVGGTPKDSILLIVHEKVLPAMANSSLAEQQERATTAERSLIELQQQIKARRLSKEQSDKIRDSLLKFPPATIQVLAYVGSEDAPLFALELITAIEAGGWKVEKSGLTPQDAIVHGLCILSKPAKGEHEPKHAEALRHALREAGLEAGGLIDPKLTEGEVVLFVGSKPN